RPAAAARRGRDLARALRQSRPPEPPRPPEGRDARRPAPLRRSAPRARLPRLRRARLGTADDGRGGHDRGDPGEPLGKRLPWETERGYNGYLFTTDEHRVLF